MSGAGGMPAQKNKVYFYKGAIIMKKENIKKVVLAYSGGLDTSIIIPWLKETTTTARSSPFPVMWARAPSWTAWKKRPRRPALPSCMCWT